MLSQKELFKVFYAVFVPCNQESQGGWGDIVAMTEISIVDDQAHCKTQSQFKLFVKKHFIIKHFK